MARRAMLLAVCFVALKLISMDFVYAPLSSALLWLPAGLSLAFLLRSLTRLWPALLGAVLVAPVQPRPAVHHEPSRPQPGA